jgi:hypothetical protein
LSILANHTKAKKENVKEKFENKGSQMGHTKKKYLNIFNTKPISSNF